MINDYSAKWENVGINIHNACIFINSHYNHLYNHDQLLAYPKPITGISLMGGITISWALLGCPMGMYK